MKKIRFLGFIVVLLAIAVLATGIYANNAKDGDGSFAKTLADARATIAAMDDAAKAGRNADSVAKKADTAAGKIADAQTDAAAAREAALALDEALEAGESGDADVDALTAALEKISSGVDNVTGTGLADIVSGADSLETLTAEKVLALYQEIADKAVGAVADAEEAILGVQEGVAKVCDLSGVDCIEMEAVAVTEEPECGDAEACHAAVEAMIARAEELTAYEPMLPEWAEHASEAAKTAAARKLTTKESLTVKLADNFIGMVFTAALLLFVALMMIFCAGWFRSQWSKNPVFSVGFALFVMLVFQTYALGFDHATFGAWGKFWFDNTFNVLRANTGVGIVALGMTLVIITGGIDLAVGSTLAGVGTVLMTMIDTGDHGFLVKFGITGVPAFVIGIAVALVVGAGVGAVIGVLVTKGRIPPFIVTLGVMQVVRSVAQYFTKSYTPTVPKSFELISNYQMFGQRPMTIIYWVILAVIFYLVMKHTAFGRHVYAVGSNERTTRLSGINTNKVKMMVYMISGLMVAVASVIQLSRLGGMDVASAGNGYEMDAIAACVVGGTSMAGGKGSIVGTVLGVLIIGIMNNLLILLGVDSFLTEAFKGAIVVISVLMQRKEKLS